MTAGNVRQTGQRYRKRRPLPALLFILVLGIAASIVWLRVMTTETEATGAAHCDPPPTQPTQATQPEAPPPSPATLGKPQEINVLDSTAPAPPDRVLVRVLNASNTRGAAGIVTETLRTFGFTQVAEPDNDPIYGDAMTCRAQIRFGPQGEAAARTLSLVEPCAELVRDDRQDATVDVAIGDEFDDLNPNRHAVTALEQLTAWSQQNPPVQGGLQADEGPQPKLDAAMLSGARDVRC